MHNLDQRHQRLVVMLTGFTTTPARGPKGRHFLLGIFQGIGDLSGDFRPENPLSMRVSAVSDASPPGLEPGITA